VNYHIQVKLDLNAFAVMGKQVDAVQGSFDEAKKMMALPKPLNPTFSIGFSSGSCSASSCKSSNQPGCCRAQHLAGIYGARGVHGVSPFNDSQQSLNINSNISRLPLTTVVPLGLE
jgi:hypothetical protein